MRATKNRSRRVIGVVGASVLGVLVLAIGAFVFWANLTYAALPEPLTEVARDDRVSVAERDGAIVMTPTSGAGESGLVFFAGAKVEPEAYEATFRETVAQGRTVVIVQSFLNLPLLETRPLSDFTGLAPEVDTWAVGGHSMGGVQAWRFAASDPKTVQALVLFASYCADDALAHRDDLDVLSLSAANDGLATPEKIEVSRADLPDDTVFEAIEGAVHAQFGAYGEQPGDGTPTISDDRARAEISAALESFFGLAAEEGGVRGR
ncbi:alpha/beta hydrolase [Leucobacter sp. USCH14]|uniref:alpha/beta hydrolase n=1 Tax=Leucobacter sp. USCH14 TaxID=3024838 RepID=UPI00309E729E